MISCNTSEPWRPMGHVLDLYVLPVVCVIGLMLNMACLFVFTRRRSHPLVPALIVLSVCDSLQLLISLFVLYLPALHDHLEMDMFGTVGQIAYIATGALAGGLLASNCASIWTMCYISIQRHRAIISPLSTVTNRRSGIWALICIAVAALLFNAPVWFEFSWHVDEVLTDAGEKRLFLFHTPSALAQSVTYRFVNRQVLYPIAVYIGPLVLISVLNLRILTHIFSASKTMVQSIGYQRRMEKEKRAIWLLISIVLFFFLCHTGGLIIRFVDHRKYGEEPCFVFAKDFINFLFNINSFVNPMLYFFFTKQFKDLRVSFTFLKRDSPSRLLQTTWLESGNRNNSITKRLLSRLSSRSVISRSKSSTSNQI
ncbi:unnamed protein product [Bursaphelenchus okinawaensis]|uniref:G-protein coupled receptors family 1 profile domain-containing protein n=1 Tax=Bursaphelenchus okinawaensis TaxID=465554 RepID=A0A811KS28_9BILA|nr:unnamed protein product [Bursaphelenchus okinawaensis]CAG9109800.1 unnamed protein product [Bursaphelenchus okinawaensis]